MSRNNLKGRKENRTSWRSKNLTKSVVKKIIAVTKNISDFLFSKILFFPAQSITTIQSCTVKIREQLHKVSLSNWSMEAFYQTWSTVIEDILCVGWRSKHKQQRFNERLDVPSNRKERIACAAASAITNDVKTWKVARLEQLPHRPAASTCFYYKLGTNRLRQSCLHVFCKLTGSSTVHSSAWNSIIILKNNHNTVLTFVETFTHQNRNFIHKNY